MRRPRVILTAITASLFPLTLAGQPSARTIDAIVASARRTANVPALGAAVVSRDGLVAIGIAGVRAANEPAAMRTTDAWHIGSCTKAMTAVLIARLVDRGVVRWESTVAELWPDPSRHPAWNRITVAQLLAHRSGMPANPPDSVWEATARSTAAVPAQRARLARALFASPPEASLDSVTIYSNAAFLAVGALIERRTGTSWEALMQREVFAPLHMASAGFGAPARSNGHVEDSSGTHAIPRGPGADNPPATGPAGAVHVSLADWGRFVAAVLRGANGDGAYLSRAQWQRLLTPANDRADYVLGWKRVHNPSTPDITLEHLGSNGFWIVQASLAPRRGYAILIAANLAVDRLEPVFARLTHALGDSAAAWVPSPQPGKH